MPKLSCFKTFKTMKKAEATQTPKVMKWMQAILPRSSPFEIKHTRGEVYFLMKELKEHQRNWLMACTTKDGCTWKIPDVGYGYNPFDAFHFKKAKAYVVIVYPTSIVAIEIRNLKKVKGPRLEELEAHKIATYEY